MAILFFDRKGNEVGRWEERSPAKIVNSYWTNDKNEQIERAYLENTVYFHLETENIPNGDILKIQLFDEDTFLDDKKFAGKEIIQEITIKDNKGVVELYLPDSWATDLENEKWVIVPKIQYRKLYWKATYKYLIENEKIKTFLKIFHSKRNLYVTSKDNTNNFPELYDVDGSEIAIALISGVHELAENTIKSFVDENINRIALVKLEKGYIVDNTNKVHTGVTSTGTDRKLYSKTCYTNNGIALKTLQGKDFTLPNGTTTKGISQYDYFSTHGSKVKMLGILKNAGTIFSVFDLVDITRFGMNADHNQLMPIPIPGANVLGMVAQTHFKETDNSLEEVRRIKLNQAKKKRIGCRKKTC